MNSNDWSRPFRIAQRKNYTFDKVLHLWKSNIEKTYWIIFKKRKSKVVLHIQSAIVITYHKITIYFFVINAGGEKVNLILLALVFCDLNFIFRILTHRGVFSCASSNDFYQNFRKNSIYICMVFPPCGFLYVLPYFSWYECGNHKQNRQICILNLTFPYTDMKDNALIIPLLSWEDKNHTSCNSTHLQKMTSIV